MSDVNRPSVGDEIDVPSGPDALRMGGSGMTGDEVELSARIESAAEVALCYGQIDGAHHKTWVIDQMLRRLLGSRYAAAIAKYEAADDDPDEDYEWDCGCAP